MRSSDAALRRGMPRLTYLNADAMLPGVLDQRNPISFGGVLNFGVVARPRKQIDFAMAVAVGFGDIAPFTLTLRGPHEFSIGKGYSYPQSLVVDILRDTGVWVAEQLRKLSKPVRETCVLFGRDEHPIATLGTLTDDGERCELQGQRYQIGDQLYSGAPNRRVCMDAEATRCITVQQVGRLAVESGALSETVASSLGHGSFAMTEKYYAQASSDSNARTARVDQLLTSGRAAEPIGVEVITQLVQKMSPQQREELMKSMSLLHLSALPSNP